MFNLQILSVVDPPDPLTWKVISTLKSVTFLSTIATRPSNLRKLELEVLLFVAAPTHYSQELRPSVDSWSSVRSYKCLCCRLRKDSCLRRACLCIMFQCRRRDSRSRMVM